MKKNIKEIIDFTIQALIATVIGVASVVGLGYGLMTEDGTILILTYCGFCVTYAIAGFLAIDIMG